MERLLLAACFFIIPWGGSQGLTIHTDHSQINVTVGGHAFFSVRPSEEVKSGKWEFKETDIATWVGTNEDLNNAYNSRAELFLPNGSFLLNSVTTSDSGDYTVTMNPKTGPQQTATIALLVLEPVSNVTVKLNNSNPVENLDTIDLTCDALGSVQTRRWFKNDQPIVENDRILISPNYKTLTISRVNRNDGGTYKCFVGNELNNGSAEIVVKVNYGPENIRIEPQGPVVADIGSTVTLTCSALSIPNGEFNWLKGISFLQSGETFTIKSLQAGDLGNYTCQVKNNITMKSANRTVEIIPKSSTAQSLSGGVIAGIVLGVVGGCIVVIAAVVVTYKKCAKRLKAGTAATDCKMTCQENKPTSQTEYAAVERKPPQQPRSQASSNGANTASSQVKDVHIIYTSPTIVNQGARTSKETVIDNKTDYAELKYK